MRSRISHRGLDIIRNFRSRPWYFTTFSYRTWLVESGHLQHCGEAIDFKFGLCNTASSRGALAIWSGNRVFRFCMTGSHHSC